MKIYNVRNGVEMENLFEVAVMVILFLNVGFIIILLVVTRRSNQAIKSDIVKIDSKFSEDLKVINKAVVRFEGETSDLHKQAVEVLNGVNKTVEELISIDQEQGGGFKKENISDYLKLISDRDYYAIKHLTSKYSYIAKIRDEIYKALKHDYYEIQDITIKREVLKMLDELTDNFLDNCKINDFSKAKKMKTEVEELYKDLMVYLGSIEEKVTKNKITILTELINKIDDTKDFNLLDKLITEINELDVSLNKTFLKNNDNLYADYTELLSFLSNKIKKKEDSILYRENMRALRIADFIRKKFNKEKGTFSDFDEKLIDKFVDYTDFSQYEKLLPDSLQYCEQAKQEVISKLSPKQYKVYAKKVVEREFGNER